jgi:hypothetical protein
MDGGQVMANRLFTWLFGPDPRRVPEPPPAAEERIAPRRPKVAPSHPHGYVADESRADVFDPALKQHANAFVKASPRLDEARGAAFRAAKAALLERCVYAIGQSEIVNDVVFRGSITLRSWFEARARDAKDIDLVVRDPSIAPSSDAAERILARLTTILVDVINAHGTPVGAGDVAGDEIWTYERAEGRRLTCTWQWEEGVRDAIQIDVVFRESMCFEPVLTEASGTCVLFASREESLAWKLLWLTNDIYPQGKDLYDAVLLAESTKLPPGLLNRVFVSKYADLAEDIETQIPKLEGEADWETFALEYPKIATCSSAAEMRQRLVAALQPNDAST